MRVHIRVKLKEPPEASRPIESRSKDAAALWRRSSLNGADEQVGLARVSEPTCPQTRRKLATMGNTGGTGASATTPAECVSPMSCATAAALARGRPQNMSGGAMIEMLALTWSNGVLFPHGPDRVIA